MCLRRLLPTALVALLPALALSACSSSDVAGAPEPTPSTYYDVVSEPEIKPGDPVPVPTGKVVLTLRGVPNTNVGKTLRFDLATLEKLGVVSYSVFDRQAEGRDVTFSGPLLKSVLDVAGATGTNLHCIALNDYAVDVPAADADALPVILATKADGKKMSVAHYGPTRFIYPTDGFDLDSTIYDPRWIWQLETIVVK